MTVEAVRTTNLSVFGYDLLRDAVPADERAAFEKDVLRCFDARRSLARRELPGGPGPRQVRSELRRWTRELRPRKGRP